MARLTEKVQELEIQNADLLTKYKELKQMIENIQNNQINNIMQTMNELENNIIIESKQRETVETNIKNEINKIAQMNNSRNSNPASQEKQQVVEMATPLFFGNERDQHPKTYLRDLDRYFTHKNISERDKMIVIENSLKSKAAMWYNMIKDVTISLTDFKERFLHHFFSEQHQWNIFIQCTEAGKKPIHLGFQEHFHRWMNELKYLESPKITEEQGIKLVMKHFPLAVQAYVQPYKNKKFLDIWEKLGEIENREKSTENLKNINHKQQTFSQKYEPLQKSEKSQAVKQITVINDEEDDCDQQQSKNGIQGVGEVVDPQHQLSLD